MRHRVAHRKLGRVTEHRISLLRNQAEALIRHERIQTTVPKAQELRPFVERLISVAKRGLADGPETPKALHARRMILQDIPNKTVVGKLFETIAPRFETRKGGYTRLLRVGVRKGDAAPVAQIELVGSEYNPNLEKTADEAPAPKATGVRGRLQAAASRLRGKKANEGAGDGDTRKPQAPPRKRAAKKSQSGG